MSKLTDERTKLTANWLNAMASGVMITGVVAPLVAAYFKILGASEVGLLAFLVGAAAWYFGRARLTLVCKNHIAEA